MSITAFWEEKMFTDTDAYIASACIIFVGVPSDKVNSLANVRVNIGENYTRE